MGDSTESGLGFNYLAFLKDVIDCSVVLLENEGVIASSGERRRSCERDAAAVIAALGEIGRRTLDLVEPVAEEHSDNAIGRCATSIATSAREAVEREAQQIRSALEADLADAEDVPSRLRAKNAEVIDKLLRAHDLPLAEKIYEIVFAPGSVTASIRQHTTFGVDASVAIEIPSASVLQPDLRVDKLIDNVEVSLLEVGGWLRKSDKLVTHKIGRYIIGTIVVGNHVTIRLRATPEAESASFDLVMTRTGEILIENISGEPARELTIDEVNRPRLQILAEKLEAAVRLLGDRRVGTAAVLIDGVALADHAHPRVLAERLILAVAPMVHRIAQHSRSPGELVLRRMLGEDRREEIFVSTAELVKRWSALPPAAREVFAALRLEADAPAPGSEDEAIPELTDVEADDSNPHPAPSVIVESSLEGRLAKLTRLDQARLSAAIDAALDDEEIKN